MAQPAHHNHLGSFNKDTKAQAVPQTYSVNIAGDGVWGFEVYREVLQVILIPLSQGETLWLHDRYT